MTQNTPPDGRMAKWILLLTLLLALAARLAAGGEPDAEEPEGALYQKAKRASVEVLVDGHLSGTGWFAERQGLVFTAAHIIGRPGRNIELLRIIRGKQPGQSLKLTVLGPDGTGTREVTVRLGKLEVGWP